MSTPTALPPAALPQLAPATAPGAGGYLPAGLARGALFLVPVPLAVAAAGPLAQVPWQVPVGAAAAGWCALSGLGHLGQEVAGRSGTGPAVRLVLAGFGAVAAAWSGLLAVAPAALAGTDRALAYAVSLPVLVLLAALTAALATGTVPGLLRWSVPVLAVAGATIAGWHPAGGVPVGTGPLLAAGVGLVAVGAFRPARQRRTGTRPARVGVPELRRGTAHLALGLGQAAAVVLVWRAGQPATLAAVVPLLLTLPPTELWVGWHLARVAAGLARYDDRDRHRRYARRLGWMTLAALLPPLVAGAALAGTAPRLPYGLSAHPDASALVLAVAGGVLLAGVVATGRLLAARDRPAAAAAVTGGAVAGAVGLAAAGAAPPLPATVTALAAAYAAGLVLVGYVLAGPRSTR